jgi:type I restriction enzyme S subunit
MSEVVNIPQLRFPEFSDAWEEKNVGDVLTIGSGRDYKHLNNGDIPVYGTGGYMTSVDSFLYDGESVCIGRKGTIDKPVLIDGKFWTVDTLFYTHSFVDLLPKFLFPLFKRINWKKYNEASGVPSLSKSTIEKIKLSLPTKPEQQKIAAFLTTVDSKIEQLSKKQELLGSWKKGLMQQIFSQATRFKADDGCDFPDWEERKLGNLTKVVVGGTPSTSNESYWNNGSIPWLSSGGINDGNVIKASKLITQEGLDNSSAKLMPKGTTLLAMTGATLGRVGYLLIETSGNQSVAGLIPNHNFYSKFLFYTLFKNKQTILSMAGGAAQAGINKATIESFKFKFPIVEEQTKIANFLSSIDTKIEQVGKQLIESKQFKKALLQQMFI